MLNTGLRYWSLDKTPGLTISLQSWEISIYS